QHVAEKENDPSNRRQQRKSEWPSVSSVASSWRDPDLLSAHFFRGVASFWARNSRRSASTSAQRRSSFCLSELVFCSLAVWLGLVVVTQLLRLVQSSTAVFGSYVNQCVLVDGCVAK